MDVLIKQDGETQKLDSAICWFVGWGCGAGATVAGLVEKKSLFSAIICRESSHNFGR